ncbi:hypothetical protein V1527DRAFT_453049 [Lipomyces starkeyi]
MDTVVHKYSGYRNEPSPAWEPVWSLLITWAAEEFQDDAELRGLLCAVGNSIGSAFNMWVPIVLFPTYEAPHYDFGYIVRTVFDVIDFAALLMFLYSARRDRERKNVIINEFGYAVDRDEYLQNLKDLRVMHGVESASSADGASVRSGPARTVDEKMAGGKITVQQL